MKPFRWYFLRWLCGWADVAEGLLIVLSLGFWWPGISLKASKWFLDSDTPEE